MFIIVGHGTRCQSVSSLFVVSSLAKHSNRVVAFLFSEHVEIVWAAEEKAKTEQRRLDALKKEKEEERQIEELRKLQAESGLVS